MSAVELDATMSYVISNLILPYSADEKPSVGTKLGVHSANMV